MHRSCLATLLAAFVASVLLIAGCEDRGGQVDVLEREVEIDRDANGTEIEVEERTVITEPDGTRREVETEREYQVPN